MYVPTCRQTPLDDDERRRTLLTCLHWVGSVCPPGASAEYRRGASCHGAIVRPALFFAGPRGAGDQTGVALTSPARLSPSRFPPSCSSGWIGGEGAERAGTWCVDQPAAKPRGARANNKGKQVSLAQLGWKLAVPLAWLSNRTDFGLIRMKTKQKKDQVSH